MDSLPGVMWHRSDAWARRGQPNILLAHYADLSADLDDQMRKIANRLRITVPNDDWLELVDAATFDRMREQSTQVVPAAPGLLKDPTAFFRRGSSGAGREVLTPEEMSEYQARVATLTPQDLIDWLHRNLNCLPAPKLVRVYAHLHVRLLVRFRPILIS